MSKMSEPYFNLKQKLEDLGYNYSFPVDAVPLVESILADLLQTTRSLQHYMDLSKEALIQRDTLMLEAEPYKCDNAKLIQDNNHLHKEILKLKEENLRLTKESKRKQKFLAEELSKKENLVSKLQHDVRDLTLRGLCADTLSSRIKSKRKDGGDTYASKVCICEDRKNDSDKDLIEMTRKMQLLEEKNEEYNDEIIILKNQVEYRDSEIIRLNMLLEGGRPINVVNKDCCKGGECRGQDLIKKIREIEITNDNLRKEHETSLEKQHEAMLRALSLADKNKVLHDELQKVDALALKVEEDCNKRLATMMNEINFLQTRIEGLTIKNAELEKEISQRTSRLSSPSILKIQESLNATLKEKDALQKEITDLVNLNKSLQEKISSLTYLSKEANKISVHEQNPFEKCPSKEELLLLLETDRKKYEKHMIEVQEKLSETMNLFGKHMAQCKDKISENSLKYQTNPFNTEFVRDLNNKLCESDQKILMLTKENEELKTKILKFNEGSHQNFKDVINQLNAENAELSKDNILLTQQLSQYRSLQSAKHKEKVETTRMDTEKLKTSLDKLSYENQLLHKDKQEYKLRYKDAMEMVEKLKGDLAFKQKEIEQILDENASYKMTHRTGKASVDHLKEECNFLREQIKRMQSDVIKEKTVANQIKNIQLETERSSNEIQNELFSAQKKLGLSKDNVDTLERKCKDLQAEILTMRSEKSNLIENLRKVDQDRDKLVIELDQKTEASSVLEQKIKSQAYEINKLENQNSELKRKLNVSRVSEHKLVDNEAQIAFLNGEILRLTQQLDTAVIENKHLQNNLADVNGTLKINKIEYEKSRKEVDCLKQQLQHYVAEIRRIEELLSQKEAERSDMLEQFASLSVEANILENTNHSLESESASKTMQLQTFINKIQTLETKLLDKENIIDNQSTHIAALTCKITSLEGEIKLVTEEKGILEQNVAYLKQMCNNIQSEHSNNNKCRGDTDSELKLYENRIKSLSNSKAILEVERDEMKESLMTTEKLLSNARHEIVELKLALQDATSETKSLQEQVNKLSSRKDNNETGMMSRELDLPLMLEETIHEVSHEEDEDSSRYHEIHKRYSKYSHSGTI